MPIPASSDAPDDTEVMVGVAILITMVVAVGHMLVLFIAAMLGLVEQLASPNTPIDVNPTVLGATAFPLYIFTYLTAPELRQSRRLNVALVGTLAGTIVCTLATAALAPSIDRSSSFTFASGAYLLFVACGLLPALAIARGYVFFDRDARVAAAGDHYIDTSQLDTETKRLVAKHAPALKALPGWRPPALFGAKDAFTHSDLRRILALEEEEAQRLRDLHETRAATAREARHDAHHAFILSLSPHEKALFEATLRADVEAVNGMTAYKEALAAETVRLTEENHNLRASIHASTELEHELQAALAHADAQRKEITALTNTIDRLRGAAADRDALERTRSGQAHEIEWLWGERARLTALLAVTGRGSATIRKQPTVVWRATGTR